MNDPVGGAHPLTSVPNRATPVIAVAGLTVERGGRSAIADLSLHIDGGQVVGLLGPSGCGKTTLMRSIVGVQRVNSGTITVLGLPAGDASLRTRVAYTTQAPAVYADLSVRENLRYFGRILDVDRGRVEAVIEMVHLGDHADTLVDRLSGGERARVSLGSALLGDAELLVLDEPTVGLDPLLRRDLWAIFHQIAQQGKTLLISSHVLDEARRCDHLVLMREGHVLATGSLDELRQRTGRDDAEEVVISLIEQTAGAPK